MKKLIFVAVVVAVVALAFGALAAQQKATPAPAKTAPAGTAFQAAKGVIEKIDAAAKTFEINTLFKVKGKYTLTGKMLTLTTDDKTKFFTLVNRKEKKLSFADLKVGMTLGISYKVEAGKNIAISVEVR
jgi:hypothetical protein